MLYQVFEPNFAALYSWDVREIVVLLHISKVPFPEISGVFLQNACSLLGNMAVLLGPFSPPDIRILSPVIFVPGCCEFLGAQW